MNTVIFAGGCFWCVEHDLRELPGIITVTSGYSGGDIPSPTYENHSGYREAVRVVYDSSLITFKKLTQFFLDHIDPTDAEGQFADRGESYKTAIYFTTAEEKIIANELLQELDESHIYTIPHAVDVLPAQPFYEAEEYHQNYAEKNKEHYQAYRIGSGREDFINRTCSIREEKHVKWKN